jgi:NADPH-dependent 2,4-dienoyl-CoA reductase/sulfur reductase-like enzyme
MTGHVVIGAGKAGVRAAAAFRDASANQVTLTGDEAVPLYARPALSKPDADGGIFRPIGVALSAIDRAVKIVLSDGSSLGDGTVNMKSLLRAT